MRALTGRKRKTRGRIAGLGLILLLNSAGCSKKNGENPFSYSFVNQIHLKKIPNKPYSDYKAFYLLTEDFEPFVATEEDIREIRDVLHFASGLSSSYGVPWTHFVDANALAPAFLSGDGVIKEDVQAMIADLTSMRNAGDDCELHLHGPLSTPLLAYLKSDRKERVKIGNLDAPGGYRQRRSFFFHSFYEGGFRELVTSLVYGKAVIERCLYDDKEQVLAFRPGGWDHGSSDVDTRIYFEALAASGIAADSGLSGGNFGTGNWRVGNKPGANLAVVRIGEKKITEVSPIAAPYGYLNPVVPSDIDRLVDSSSKDEVPVIVSVYHLSALQETQRDSQSSAESDPGQVKASIQQEREKLEAHFKQIADMRSRKVLYPITLRQLLLVIADQQQSEPVK